MCTPEEPDIAYTVWCHTLPARYSCLVHLQGGVLDGVKALLSQGSTPAA